MEPTKTPMNDTTVTPCILNVEVSSEGGVKGEHLIDGWKVFMEGYDEFLINRPLNAINDLAPTVN